MKKFKKILSTISMLFIFLVLGNFSVFAQDSDTGPPEGYPHTQLYFNKESVKDGDQVTATLELDNQTNADLMNVTLETTLPEGLYSESTTRTYDKIAAGQKILHSFTIQVGDKSSVIPVSLSSIPSNPVTGAPGTIGIGIALTAALIVFAVWLCKRRKGQMVFSIALCLLLTTQLLLTAFPNPVYAEEESDTDTPLSDEVESISYSVSSDLTVNESTEVLSTTVTIGSVELVELSEITYEALQTNSSVAAGAAFFDIVISSQSDPFSDAVKAEDIVLKNAFENARIDTITLLDEHTLALSLTGPLDKEDESNALLELNKNCFKQDGEKQGRLMVDVSSPLPYFAEGTDNVHLNEGDTAVLQFSIDTAQFSQTADASAFTFDDPAIQPVNLTIPSTLSSRDGLLEVRVDGAESKTDILNALRGATMTIDSAALNCDSLTLPLTLEEERINTDLILANAVRSSEKETQATAEFTGRVSSLNGSVDLTQGVIALADAPQPGVSVSPLKISGDSNNLFSFTVTIDDPELPNWAEEDEGLETFFAYWAYSQKLYLDTNCVIDAYGVPVQASEYAMVVYESDASDDELLASNASGKDLLAKSFTYTSKILSIANFFAKEAPWGIGAGILGLGGDALSSSGMGEIKDNLIALNAEVAELNKKADAISQDLKYLVNHIKDTEMRNKVSAFGKEADRLSWTVNKINSQENNAIANLMEVTDTASNEYHTYVNQINNTVAYSAGGGDTFAKDTLAFGKSILGDDFMESDSTLDVYVNLYNSRCNWASQTINPKSNFLAYANSLYLKAYMMSMCYMKSSNTNHQYDHAIEEMKTQFQAFLKKSDVYNEAMVLPEGKDINLIDGKEYSYNGLYSYNLQNHFERSFPGRMFSTSYISSKPMYMKSFTELVRNTFDARNKSFNTINKNPDMETLIAMKSRLNSSGKTSILEELTDLGFNTKGGKVLYIGNSSLIDEDLTPSISIGYEYGAKAVYRFYGDVFNLETGTAQVNEHLFDVNVSAFAYKKWDAKISLNLLPDKIISFIR
ncbi:COG1470 family protein [Eubacterium callanderi]|uniref:Uncharacterized protein n=3 Tax=Eubacterium callanderi TaxID=53442 RepID=E3GJZ8_9FIRM|nr:hypothetical protein [Eubacterium callanderi]OEZ03993.1 hypothetical protein BUME_26480 [[Butyribacterium] methylotrophicum]ADO36160.1 hypothetical protein ELI_1172 [Eubacterium callanderi]MCB7105547.1 hypothetical protein [Eubacterium callanderi]MCG4820895.1 hypothetical protein [Eubacterium callanderi]WPK86342.1 hypothetical protein EUCAMar_39350 [Eubacterium callanderi]